MLVLSRRVGEKILIGDDVVIEVTEIRGDKVRLGFTTPKDVSVDSIRIDGVSAKVQRAVSQLGPLIAHDKLEGQMIYRFKPDDLARADGLGYTVGAIDVTAQGLAIQLIAKP